MNLNEFKREWTTLIGKFTQNAKFIEDTWVKIVKHYTGKGRYYHNLNHIQALLKQARHYQTRLIDYDIVRLVIWYHDIIYQAHFKDNEERSAALFVSHLLQTDLEMGRIEKGKAMIEATKSHQIAGGDSDFQYFLDFDLSILGSTETDYAAYSAAIRKEFRIYPKAHI